MSKTIVLVGNQNCGKTTLFNAITGANQYVGNWPGVTVERVIGKVSSRNLKVVDLPGLYSLSPYSPEELVSRNYLLQGNYQVLVNVVDATHLERSLSLTCELMQFNRPMVLAVNMMDRAVKDQIKIDLKGLSQTLGIPVVAISAATGDGLEDLFKAIEQAKLGSLEVYDDKIQAAVAEIALKLQEIADNAQGVNSQSALASQSDVSVKAQQAASIQEQSSSEVKVASNAESEPQDDKDEDVSVCKRGCCCGSHIVSRELHPDFKRAQKRANRSSVTQQARVQSSSQARTSQQFNFVALSLLQHDRVYLELYKDHEDLLNLINRHKNTVEQHSNSDVESLIAQERYTLIDRLMARYVSRGVRTLDRISQKIDNIVTHKFLAIPIFVAVVYVVYYLAISTIGTMGTDYANDVLFGEYATNAAQEGLAAINAPEWLSGLVIDGIIGGVGAVLGFVPQMIVLFVLLSLLEQCGYMTRVAFVLDRLFRQFGLSGRVIIPMVVATGCGVPALMATNTIDNINEKRLSVITTTFMPCSAKLPILAMIGAAFFPESTLVAPAIYFMAIFAIAFTAYILKKESAFKEEVSPFVMEMPNYALPQLKNVIRSTYERCKAFVMKAGTVIFSTVVVVWFLSSFNFTADGFGMVEVDKSMLAAIGSVIAFIFIPLGFASWQAAVAIFTGLLAKENVVGTLAVLLGLGEVAEDDASLGAALNGEFSTTAAALAFLTFNLFSTPCIAALGAMKRQLGSKKMFAFAVAYLLVFAYAFSLVVYHAVGLFTGTVAFNMGTVIAGAVVVFALYLILRPERKGRVNLQIPAKQI